MPNWKYCLQYMGGNQEPFCLPLGGSDAERSHPLEAFLPSPFLPLPLALPLPPLSLPFPLPLPLPLPLPPSGVRLREGPLQGGIEVGLQQLADRLRNQGCATNFLNRSHPIRWSVLKFHKLPLDNGPPQKKYNVEGPQF